jgi:polysaccharide biosynthesis/export protein
MNFSRWITRTAAMMMVSMISCAINPQIQVREPKPSPTVQNLHSTAAASADMTTPVVEAEYRLGFGDEIEIKFFNNSEYNENVQVRPDGKISLQRIEDIRVVGMPISKLDDIITRAYAEILVDPDVTVFLRNFGGRRVYVMGEVQQPGSYDLVRGMTVLRAIAAAGGPANGAKMTSVLLLRRSEERGLQAERLDLAPSRMAQMMENDLAMQAFDLVYIPKTFIADVDAWVSQVYRVVLTPLDITSRAFYYQSILGKKN